MAREAQVVMVVLAAAAVLVALNRLIIRILLEMVAVVARAALHLAALAAWEGPEVLSTTLASLLWQDARSAGTVVSLDWAAQAALPAVVAKAAPAEAEIKY